MTITYNAPELVDEYTWRFSWSSSLTAPTYYVYINGLLVETTTVDEYSIMVEVGENVELEVFDTAIHTPTVVWPGNLTIYWEDVTDADYYVVEEYISSAWTEQARVPDNGEPQFRFITRWLEDVTTHQFRVRALRFIPMDGTYKDLEGTVTTLTALMVRRPDVPDVIYAYDEGTGKVTIITA